jgi:hypothetical protein
MSFVKNKKPLEVVVYSNGHTKYRWKKRHTDNCSGHCPCCILDYDCSCGAITWEHPKTTGKELG